MTDEERYIRALEEIRIMALNPPANVLIRIATTANEALNPPLQYEEVEVVLYKCMNCNWTTLNKMSANCCKNPRVIKLSGIDKKPLPRKVKRREEIVLNGVYTKLEILQQYPKALFYAEWEEEAP